MYSTASGCGNNPCKNGGTCTEETDGAICCACPTCYHGDLCQYCEFVFNINFCSSKKSNLSVLVIL